MWQLLRMLAALCCLSGVAGSFAAQPLAAQTAGPIPADSEREASEAEGRPDAVTGPVLHTSSPKRHDPEEGRAAAVDQDLSFLSVPVQVPVPLPPRTLATNSYDRAERLMDVGTDLPTLVAREGGFALGRSWGGPADRLGVRGAGNGARGDLAVELDGIPLEVPLAGRGAGYVDLRLIPMTGVGSYEVALGPIDGGYAGKIRLWSRPIDGAAAHLLLGSGQTRRFSVVGGGRDESANAMLALEGRQSQLFGRPAADDRYTLLGRADSAVGEDLTVGLMLRHYRGVWSQPGLLASAKGKRPSASPSDGGDLAGLGGALKLTWQRDGIEVQAHAGYLDDRYQAFVTSAQRLPGAPQQQTTNHNRVLRARVMARTRPAGSLPLELGGGFEGVIDHAVRRRFATEGRKRLNRLEGQDGDLMRASVFASAGFALTPKLEAELRLRLDQLTLRRQDPRRGPTPRTSTALTPAGTLELVYFHAPWLRATLRAGQEHRVEPNALLGERLAEAHDSAELALAGRATSSRWRLAWSVSGFGSIHGEDWFTTVPASDDLWVSGAEASLQVRERQSGVALAARGGPLVAGHLHDEAQRADHVPAYVAHVGLLRNPARGVAMELWASSHGSHWVGPGEKSPPLWDVTVRVGYGGEVVTLWVGADNLLDRRGAADSLGRGRYVPRAGRMIYGMLVVEP